MGEKDFEMFGNIKLLSMDKQLILEEITNRLLNRMKTRIFFINAHCFNIAQKNRIYAGQINDAEIVLNDGIGVELGAKLFDIELKENLNGTDFTPEVLKISQTLEKKVFLLGGKQGVAKKAKEKLQNDFPGLRIIGYSDGYFEDSNRLIAEINSLEPDVLLVGMGVPLQENWITANFDKLNATVIMAVGAFLDFASGTVMRAPIVFRKLRIEWVFRLFKEPQRMWKRYMVGNAVFFINILKYSKIP